MRCDQPRVSSNDFYACGNILSTSADGLPGLGTVFTITVSPFCVQSSCITTVSAPTGIGAPVKCVRPFATPTQDPCGPLRCAALPAGVGTGLRDIGTPHRITIHRTVIQRRHIERRYEAFCQYTPACHVSGHEVGIGHCLHASAGGLMHHQTQNRHTNPLMLKNEFGNRCRAI